MRNLIDDSKNYFAVIAERKVTSKAYREHQLIGLEVAQLLGDFSHKALYMKLTKQHGKDMILKLAKSVAERKDIRNKGAYFMKVLFGKRSVVPPQFL